MIIYRSSSLLSLSPFFPPIPAVSFVYLSVLTCLSLSLPISLSLSLSLVLVLSAVRFQWFDLFFKFTPITSPSLIFQELPIFHSPSLSALKKFSCSPSCSFLPFPKKKNNAFHCSFSSSIRYVTLEIMPFSSRTGRKREREREIGRLKDKQVKTLKYTKDTAGIGGKNGDNESKELDLYMIINHHHCRIHTTHTDTEGHENNP